MPALTRRVTAARLLLPVLCLLISLASTGCLRPLSPLPPTAVAAAPSLTPLATATLAPAATIPATEQAALPPSTAATEESAAPAPTGNPTPDAEGHIYSELLPPPPLELQVVQHSPGAQLSVTEDGHSALIDVVGGSGSADIEIVSENYPELVTLQFHPPGIAQLRFAYDETTVALTLPRGNAPVPTESVTRDNATAEPISVSSPDWMNVQIVSDHPAIPLKDGYLDVQVPASFLSGQSRRFSVQWIEAQP